MWRVAGLRWPSVTTPEVRAPATEDEWRECQRIGARGFNGPLTAEASDRWLLRAHRDRCLAVFVGDEMAAWSQVRPFGQFFGGRSVPMGGYSPVVTAPEHRGHGFGSVVTAAHFPAMRERGEVIAGLYPASTQLYRNNGFEVAGVWSQRSLPSRSLHTLRPTGVAARRAGADDEEAIKACYRRCAVARDGWLDRPEVWWADILDPEKAAERHLYVVDGPDGAVAGYVRYSHRPAKPYGYTIHVHELVADAVDVTVALWRLVGSSSTQAARVELDGPPEHALLFLLSDQDLATDAELRWMLRVVDAPGAIAARGYAAAVSASVDLEVSDRQCSWNEGRWRLTVEAGSARLDKGGDGDVRLSINALAALYSGYASAQSLVRAGLITSGPAAALSDLSAVFAGPTPTIADFY